MADRARGRGGPGRRLRRIGARVLVRFGLRRSRITVNRHRSSSAAEYAQRFGAKWQVVKPAETLVRVPPIRYGHLDSAMASRLGPIPDLGVLSLDRPTIVGPLALVLSRERILIASSSFWAGRVRRIPDWACRAEVERVQGTVISLGTDYAYANYGHFLLDSLPRVALIEDAGISWDDADGIYCTVPGDHAGRLLDQLGVPADRRILAQRGRAIRPDHAIVPSFPGSRRNYPPWVVAFLRDRLGVPAGPPSRRLFIPRSEHRRILNIEELMPVLDEFGFEVFEPAAGGEDPRHAFAEAEVVVGGHGAGLADVVFCRDGTALLELLPDSHQMPYYMTAAASANLRYGYLLGSSVDDGSERRHRDYRIDRMELRAALEDLLGGCPAHGGRPGARWAGRDTAAC